MSVRRKKMSCALDLHSVSDLNVSLAYAAESGYDFISIPLVHPRFGREFFSEPAKSRDDPLTRSDMLLPCRDWTTLIVAKLSPWLQLDSAVENIRKNSELALKQEMTYAAHLGVPAVMLSLRSDNCTNLARSIYCHILRGSSIYQKLSQIWVHVPMVAPEVVSRQYRDDAQDEEKNIDTWQWWRKFLGICNTDNMIGLALELSEDVPSKEVIDRWLGEPVRCVIIPTSMFLSNKTGYPVLSRTHQSLMFRFFKYKVQVMIRGVNRHNHIKHYQQYLDHIRLNLPQDNHVDNFARGYEDYLQCPLQPLMDNLESQTYEIFEKDPVKYSEYQKAICKAFIDKVPENEIETKTLIVMVLGAGRGPLVTASLNAAKMTNRKITLYAVEKNPNAIVTLRTLKEEVWKDQVTVVSSDMRDWNPEEKADIIVSELLGSFGDNELSPECLDKAQVFLKDDGISIPYSYTSYLSPIQSAKLYNEVRQCKDKDKHPLANLETPYVVFIKNCNELAKPQDVFTFIHPNKDPEQNNSRYKIMKFKIEIDSVLHGLAGYFETCLYGDIMLSILPETYSTGMLSWFPILFPIKEPLYLKKGDELEVHFWRCITSRNVWYEWAITKPHIGTIHNPCGRSYTIGL